MGRPHRHISSGLAQSHAATARVSRLHRHRRRLSAQRSRFRCVAASPHPSPNSTSGGLVVGCLYRKVDVRSRCTSIKVVRNSSGCVIDHVVDVNYFRSVSVDVDHDVIIPSPDTSQSSSPTHDVTESMTSYTVSDMKPLPVDSETGSCDDVILSSSTNSSTSSPTHDVSEPKTPVHLIPMDSKTGTGSRRHVEIVLRYQVGRLGVAVGGTRPVKVRVVRQGGEGQLAGLVVGDEIIRVDGRDVSDAKPEVVTALLRSWPGDKLHLTIARPERDDSGHASSSSLSSPDDVTDTTSGHTCPFTRRVADCTQQPISNFVRRRRRRRRAMGQHINRVVLGEL